MALLAASETGAELAGLIEEAQDYVAASRAENTTRSYLTGWRQFEAWCADRGLVAMPADPKTVALYIADFVTLTVFVTLRRPYDFV